MTRKTNGENDDDNYENDSVKDTTNNDDGPKDRKREKWIMDRRKEREKKRPEGRKRRKGIMDKWKERKRKKAKR